MFFKTAAEVAEISFSKGELGDYIVKQVESVSDKEKLDSEIQIFQNALEFSDLKAREVMVPRAELVAIDIDKDIQELKELFMTTGSSKIPVYQNSVDDILGYVHAFELLGKATPSPKIWTLNEIFLVWCQQKQQAWTFLWWCIGTSGTTQNAFCNPLP